MISRALLYYFMILVVIALFTVQSKSVNSAIPFLLTPPEQQQPPLEPSSSSAQTIITRTFNLNIEGLTFPIRYAITGNGNIPHNILWEEHKSNILSISISSKSNGKLIIELPRALIDSPRVFVDGIHVPTLQTTINSKVRTLVINFHKDSSQIEIQNTAPPNVAPSFQPHPPTDYQVSIVQGASTMADKAFSVNPINPKTGDIVTWTNDDDTPHTITSGKGLSDSNMGKEFNSSPELRTLIAPSQTFSHKFTTAGEFAYFCEVHPTMVGEVTVMSGNMASGAMNHS
jgi:plastocyanin